MKRVLLLFTLSVLVVCAYAQKLTADAPSHVSVGEQFRLTYTTNSQDVSGFAVGSIPEELEVLMGPSTSEQSSYRMVNGQTTSSYSITYTYIICANKNGTFTIPAAQITADGKRISSNALKIVVSGSASQSQSNSGSRNRQSPTGQVRNAGSQISGSDLFIKVSASKRRVHEQEPILLTYKVFTLVSLTQLEGKMPDLKGFHTQEVQLPQQKSFKVETINGRPYRTVTWSQYVMFPQQTGKMEIPSITFNGIVVQQDRNFDPFDFFNGGTGYIEVKKKIVAPGLTIEVDPLPNRPSDFSGGVGQFDMTAQLDKTDVKANDPITLKVVVSGVGNLKLIKEPIVKFPKDFDVYDAKLTDKTKLTVKGVEGSMIYEFLAVPRHQGKFDIPEVEFVYYDTETDAYKTLKSEPFTINVAKGEGTAKVSDFTNQEDLKLLNKDIRYIKTGDSAQHAFDSFFFGSLSYWLAICILSVIFIALFVIFRKRAIDNANIGKMRGKKANKVATKRLKNAASLLKSGKPAAFYDEVLRALWGYVGDKLNIPVEQLSRENISQKLSERDVDAQTIDKFISALDECEFARYAPGDPQGNMHKTYDAAMTAIMEIENSTKKNKMSKKNSVVLLLLFLMPLSAMAVSKADADSAYAQQNYQEAIKQYEALLQNGVSSELYYNLGNAYYRTDNISRAIINYERALLLSPGDGDIRFNLQMARSKTIDKIVPESEMFFVTWYNSLVNLTSVDGWAVIALCSLALAVILALVYLFSERIALRKAGFFLGAFFVLLFVLSNVFAVQQKDKLLNRTGAIVVSSAATVKSTPAQNGTDLFVLHEGTRVVITDGTMKDWKEVRLADGKEGWIESKQIEVI